MLSVKRIRNRDYHVDLAREDYYLEGGEPPGWWHGTGATQLGLASQVSKEELHHIMDGFSPDGSFKLVQNAGTDTREIGWDYTFSAPKTVSTEWSQAGPKKRAAIQHIHNAAVRKTLDFLEQKATTRRGKGGVNKEPVKLVAALFEHATSRELQPQLHTHALLMNLGCRTDGTTGTIQISELLKEKMLLGALYRAELAQQLRDQLGYEIGPHLQGKDALFDLKGVSFELVEAFSKRREAIAERLREKGYSSAVAAAVAALDTREPKTNIPPRENLFAAWQEMGQALGYKSPRPKFVQLESALAQKEVAEKAVTDLLQRSSSFSQNTLLRRVAELAPHYGLDIEALQEAVTHRLTQADIFSLGQIQGEQHYSTTTLFLQHQAAVTTLDVSQIAQAAGLQRQGYQVLGIAPGKSALRLQNETAIKSYSLHRFLGKLRDCHVRLDKKTLVVVKGMEHIPSQQLAAVMEQADGKKALLALVTDQPEHRATASPPKSPTKTPSTPVIETLELTTPNQAKSRNPHLER
ncbi:MAG: relaxase domain-containing protein [Leptolyngbya sp. SIO4C5]|nr:relaxase domain-containing protein [Leptolyngbya sp. SIO4C5]